PRHRAREDRDGPARPRLRRLGRGAWGASQERAAAQGGSPPGAFGPSGGSTGRTAATSAVSGPHAAVSPLQHSAWFTPYIGHPPRTHAAWPWTYRIWVRQREQRRDMRGLQLR